MSLAPGSRLGPYEVVAPLGAGGMGEVYRARDTKLNRDVAIKVLPEEMAMDAERLARFKREAQLLAALNHPHIAAIYGLDEADGKPFLVLELVEGEELTERLKRGPIPADEALAIAEQIADGLEAAHEKGIVHRDLKLANVKVTTDGPVKILDFGLAKAYEGDATSANDLSQSPTISRRMTEAGLILGTAAYMSPEQARGKPVDKRADVWAFGVLLWEMLTGKRLFNGETVSDTLAAVLRQDVSWDLLPAATPLRARQRLRRCLERDPRRRLQAIGDARIEIEDTLTGAPEEIAAPVAGATAPLARRAVPWVLAGALAAGLAVVLALWAPWRPAPEPAKPVRLSVELGADASLATAGLGDGDGRDPLAGRQRARLRGAKGRRRETAALCATA